MPYSPSVKQGLLLRKQESWFSDVLIETLDEISIFETGWDCVYFENDSAESWTQQGNYPDIRVRGYAVQWVDSHSDKTEPRTNFKCYLKQYGFFKDLEDYKRFLKEIVCSEILEEIWIDT